MHNRNFKSDIINSRPNSSLGDPVEYLNFKNRPVSNIGFSPKRPDSKIKMFNRIEYYHQQSVNEENKLKDIQKLCEFGREQITKEKGIRKNEFQKSILLKAKLNYFEKDNVYNINSNQKLKDKIKLIEGVNQDKKDFVDVRKSQLSKLCLDHKYRHLLTQ